MQRDEALNGVCTRSQGPLASPERIGLAGKGTRDSAAFLQQNSNTHDDYWPEQEHLRSGVEGTPNGLKIAVSTSYAGATAGIEGKNARWS